MVFYCSLELIYMRNSESSSLILNDIPPSQSDVFSVVMLSITMMQFILNKNSNLRLCKGRNNVSAVMKSKWQPAGWENWDLGKNDSNYKLMLQVSLSSVMFNAVAMDIPLEDLKDQVRYKPSWRISMPWLLIMCHQVSKSKPLVTKYFCE